MKNSNMVEFVRFFTAHRKKNGKMKYDREQ